MSGSAPLKRNVRRIMFEVPQPLSSVVKLPLRASLSGTRLMSSAFLSRHDRQALEDAALPSRIVHAGKDLMREGDSAQHLSFVTEGWVCRYKTTRDGSRQIVALSVAGDAANLDSVMFKRPDYGVRALTTAAIVTIPRDRLLALEAEHPGIAKSIARLAMIENAILTQWALCLGRQRAQQRLAHLLCELSARLTQGEESSTFELPLTQEQLADALGLTPVHINRTMQHLRSDGLLANSGRTITLPDVVRLQKLAEFNPAYLHMGEDAVDDRHLPNPGR